MFAHSQQATWRERVTMSNHESNDEDISIGSEAYFEAVASQEETYLEETEEELRMILVFDDDLPPSRSECS
jgi:hypothetical protein